MPAVLLEYGFIDNATDATLLKDATFIERLAQATVAGITKAFNLPAAKDEVSDWARALRGIGLYLPGSRMGRGRGML